MARWPAVVVGLALALVVAACGGDDDTDGSRGAGDGARAADLQFRPVLEVLPRDAPEGPDVVSETVGGDPIARYRVGPSADPEVRVSSAKAAFRDGTSSWEVVLVLGEESQQRFDALARRCFDRDATCPTGRVAFVAADEVVSSPTIETPSGFHEITISGDFTEGEAKNLAASLAP